MLLQIQKEFSHHKELPHGWLLEKVLFPCKLDNLLGGSKRGKKKEPYISKASKNLSGAYL